MRSTQARSRWHAATCTVGVPGAGQTTAGLASAILLALACSALASHPAAAQVTPSFGTEGPLEGRVARLERILENQSGSELLLQVQRLQLEMQELRGMLENQAIALDKLQRQQRDQFLDLDARLSTPQTRSDPAPLSAPGSAPGSAPAPADSRQPPTAAQDTAPGLQDPTAAAPPPAPPTPSSPGAVGIPALPSPETIGGSERDLYSAAFELLKDRDYDQAQAAFNQLLRHYPQGEFADNARYWLGETYYVQRNYPAALAELDRLVQLHPNSAKVPGALLKIGFIQAEQQDPTQARATLERVVSDYPDSTEARLARARLERMAAGSEAPAR